ncbi:SgcJ/EcaC family oxidoreductase [Nocardia sp. CDC159]|uniref:SgcJ/EcaC family oxidoreductase n=1 Tax=Nocardia pulmonis TaxID=2951408 RepID=A0A9X2E6V6_9NOCA|nr:MULTISPECIES: SgcJ/EcaC family oxidoreductase [Nocardia]MCM6775202.1 SgcJ/EcaC family oxidoreductase [Nocardia pulmonis]MCM6789672.1 SgcJ/EcaC family oxidoreductase [Nocardia sp. CDC159]
MDPDDERKIRAVVAAQTELWVRHEMAEWGELFTEDSDFIAHSGVWWRSRAENVRGHTDIPESVIAQKPAYTQRIANIAEIAGEVALVHAVWTWPRFRPPGAAVEDRSGILTYVLVKRQGNWFVRAAHNTRRLTP